MSGSANLHLFEGANKRDLFRTFRIPAGPFGFLSDISAFFCVDWRLGITVWSGVYRLSEEDHVCVYIMLSQVHLY